MTTFLDKIDIYNDIVNYKDLYGFLQEKNLYGLLAEIMSHNCCSCAKITGSTLSLMIQTRYITSFDNNIQEKIDMLAEESNNIGYAGDQTEDGSPVIYPYIKIDLS